MFYILFIQKLLCRHVPANTTGGLGTEKVCWFWLTAKADEEKQVDPFAKEVVFAEFDAGEVSGRCHELSQGLRVSVHGEHGLVHPIHVPHDASVVPARLPTAPGCWGGVERVDPIHGRHYSCVFVVLPPQTISITILVSYDSQRLAFPWSNWNPRSTWNAKASMLSSF